MLEAALTLNQKISAFRSPSLLLYIVNKDQDQMLELNLNAERWPASARFIFIFVDSQKVMSVRQP